MSALSFLADEDFDHDVLRGVIRRRPDVDIVTVQDIGLTAQPDPAVLEWAATNKRIVLTRDVNTMVASAYDRTKLGLPMPGVFAFVHTTTVAEAIESIIFIADASTLEEWEHRIEYLPL